MDYYLIFGMVVVCMIAMIGFMGSIKKIVIDERQPIQELNISITRLNTNFENMLERDKTRDERISKHGEEIDEQREKLHELSHVVANHETRIKSVERRGNV